MNDFPPGNRPNLTKAYFTNQPWEGHGSSRARTWNKTSLSSCRDPVYSISRFTEITEPLKDIVLRNRSLERLALASIDTQSATLKIGHP
jgi:hypothetical protein